ncbi:MAG: NADH-quinone oxidoreductase subunit L, partial [Nitrospirales bacterium]|nr:NADH-quinone oxidoreductase subunit L [Nitrospirales bacterium]
LLGGGNGIAHFFEPLLGHPHVSGTHEEEMMVMGVSVAAGIGGIFLSWVMYSLKPEIPKAIAARFSGIYNTLWNKYYVDELYDAIIVRPSKWIATNVLMAVTDGKLIEGVVNGIPAAIGRLGEKLRALQSGNLQHYAMGMALGLFAILTLVLTAGR